MAAIEAGTGRPVLVLGAGPGDAAGLAALAARFSICRLEAGDAAAWIAAQGEPVGIVGVGEAATWALEAAAAAGEQAKALVLVSPAGLALDPETGASPLALEIRAARCVLIGDRDPAAAPLAAWRRALPRCHVVLVYDAAAALIADRPDAFASAAGDFLDRQERFAFMTESLARA
ncbi:MAG TPA: hypothetical protein VGG29_15025 [Caulobacteraceae bacterium]|jgi:pimeloyl-ACP methyl ester carboxylesterase